MGGAGDRGREEAADAMRAGSRAAAEAVRTAAEGENTKEATGKSDGAGAIPDEAPEKDTLAYNPNAVCRIRVPRRQRPAG